MFAMQYGFDVADAEPVRARVREIGSRFDQLPGLYTKAFLVADAIDGNPARYTPFYLWDELDGMSDFLLSDAFRAVVAKYGRPVVQRWNKVAFFKGPAIAQTPVFATQQFIDIPADVDLAELCALHAVDAEAMVNEHGLHSVFLGLDTNAWKLMKISLWQTRPALSQGSKIFEVAHLSAPALKKELAA
ncbi:DUF4865 family protein [Herbaspirillum rhizosphaerae]|uniref:DUF4865 family protein n=1 Tax=Herbaspirillum rhizosphaerae TaxID=346179 RepID=UPI00067BB4A0|nr:DUF4865 family protein [Herbaspirillum rhizosphaerae]